MITCDFVSFHDLTEKCHFLWASPSVEDVFGYTSEEIVGISPMEMILPSNIDYSKDALKENIMNDLVTSQAITRFRHKNGQTVICLVVFSMCYDMIVSSTTMLAPPTSETEGYHELRAHSSVMTRMVNTKKEEFARMKRHHEAFQANNTWNAQILEPEARVCLLLNRFTRSLTVMYASSACEKVLHIDPDDITGKPILLFIRSDDLASFVEQMDIVRGTSSIVNMRFWFQSPNLLHEIPCEVVFIGGSDAIITVIRRYKPFVRKYFIGSREQYESSSKFSCSTGWSSGYSPSSEQSPITSISSSYSTPDSQSGSWPPSFGVNRKTLSRVKIYELDDKKARPLRCIPDNDPFLVRDTEVMSQLPEFKEVIVQSYDDDDDDQYPEDEDFDQAGMEYLSISEHRNDNMDTDI
ncbi:hypothetical protein BGX27_000443 [Mortierella sp. AM989]|nr:hypothetical protein BGX27_000443 [Mortierella sp. AM989]